jgi:hypothetical protein
MYICLYTLAFRKIKSVRQISSVKLRQWTAFAGSFLFRQGEKVINYTNPAVLPRPRSWKRLMSVHLRVVQGRPHGHRLQFGPGEFVFGRGPECHIRPNSELVSRQHCLLKVADDGGVSVRDLGSTNGTLVNGRRVIGERPLALGDTLQLGPVILEIVPEDAVTSQAHSPTDEVRSLGDTLAN